MSALALLLASLLPPSQDPVPAEAPAAGEARVITDQDTRIRLLHLADGRIVRGPTRRAAESDGGDWEIKLGAQWTRLPSEAVESAVLESQALGEAAKRARSVDARSAASRAGHASWLFEQGLFAEAVKELDRALAIDPDAPEATALARERSWLFRGLAEGLPERGRKLAAPDLAVALRDPLAAAAAASASRTAREAFVAELGQRELGEPLRTVLEESLRGKSAQQRALAAFALRRLYPREAATALVNRSVLDGSEKVRHEASLALRDCGESAVAAPVVKCLGSKSPIVQKNAAESLAILGYPEAVPAMVAALAASAAQGGGASGSSLGHGYFFHGKQLAYVQDYDVEVATLASIADPVINVLQEGEVLDVRVMSINQELVVSYRAELRKSLEKITGVDPGSSAKAWESWWEKDGPTWYAQATGKSPSTPAATAVTTSGGA